MSKIIIQFAKWIIVTLLISVLLIYGAFILMAYTSSPTETRDPNYEITQDYEIIRNNGDFKLIKYTSPDNDDGAHRENVTLVEHILAYQKLKDAVLVQTNKKYVIVPFDENKKITSYVNQDDFIKAVTEKYRQLTAGAIKLEQIEH